MRLLVLVPRQLEFGRAVLEKQAATGWSESKLKYIALVKHDRVKAAGHVFSNHG